MGIRDASKSYIFFAILHFFQFVLAVTVCGLYGVELNRAAQAGTHGDSKWIYAEVVGGLSALTAILLCIPYFLRFAVAWVWNVILFILWIALFGIFAGMYLNKESDGNKNITRMRNALWVVLANAALWLVTSIAGFVYWWRHRDRVSRFTGRAKV